MQSKKFFCISKIIIKNYKTYLDLTIPFNDNISILVGPNECGKTNLLESISYLTNYKKLSKNDTCLYCENVWTEEPSFIYHINGKLLELENGFNEIQVKVNPNKFEILTPLKLKSKKVIKEMIRFYFPKGSGGHVHIKFPPALKSKYKLEEMITLKEEEEFKIPSIIEVELQQLKQHNISNSLFEKVQIERTNFTEEVSEDKDKYLNLLKEKIKVIYWNFDQTKFIQDRIDITGLSKSPEQYKYVLNMFKIAKIELKTFLNASDIQRTNMLSRINRKISNLISSNWKEQDLAFFLGMGKNNSLVTSFQENGQNVEPGKRSEGFKWYLSFLLDFNAQFGSEIKHCLILLDEPGIHLHPGGQKILMKQIEKLSKDNQIIYTTHLPFMINRMFPKRITYLNKKEGLSYLMKPLKDGVMDDNLLSSSLGFDFNSLSRWGDINLFIEGITDALLLRKIILLKAELDNEIILDMNDISFNPINGVNNLEIFVRVAQETNAKFVIFLDNDDEVKKCTKKYLKRPKLHPETIDHIVFLDDNKTIEDYIPIELLNKSLSELKNSGNPIYKKYLNFSDFIENNIDYQIKEKTSLLNQDFKAQDSDNYEEITKGDLKLDLFLHLIENIDQSNLIKFNLLIEKIQGVSLLTKKIYQY